MVGRVERKYGGTEPLNFVRILCFKERGTCEMYDVSFQQEQRFLFLNTPAEYQIDVWTPSRERRNGWTVLHCIDDDRYQG